MTNMIFISKSALADPESFGVFTPAYIHVIEILMHIWHKIRYRYIKIQKTQTFQEICFFFEDKRGDRYKIFCD